MPSHPVRSASRAKGIAARHRERLRREERRAWATVAAGGGIAFLAIAFPAGLAYSTMTRTRVLRAEHEAEKAEWLSERTLARPVHRGVARSGNAWPLYEPVIDDQPDASRHSWNLLVRWLRQCSCLSEPLPRSELEQELDALVVGRELPGWLQLDHLRQVESMLARLPEAQRRTRCQPDRLPIDFQHEPRKFFDEMASVLDGDAFGRDAALVSRRVAVEKSSREAALMLTDAIAACQDVERVWAPGGDESEGICILARELGRIIAGPGRSREELAELAGIVDRIVEGRPSFVDGLRMWRVISGTCFLEMLDDPEALEHVDRALSSRACRCDGRWGYSHGLFVDHWLVGEWERFREARFAAERIARGPAPERVARLRALCDESSRFNLGWLDSLAENDLRARAWLAVLQSAIRVRLSVMNGEGVPAPIDLPLDPRSDAPLVIEVANGRCRILSPQPDVRAVQIPWTRVEPGAAPWRDEVAIEVPADPTDG